MRKYLLVMIALFVTGQVCKAQKLTIGPRLKTEKTVTVKQSQPKMRKADAAAQEYWASAKSIYNDYGFFAPEEENRDCEYTVSLTFNGDDVTIDGLVDLSRYYYFNPTQESIQGHYDAEAHTITVETPMYDSSNTDISLYTPVGAMTYYGSDVTMVLFSGDWAKDQNNEYYLETQSQLVFDVNDDLSTITARTGFGCYAFYDYDGSSAGFIDFYCSDTLTKLTDEAVLSTSPSEISFDGPSCTVGAMLTAPIYLTNKSLADTKYTAKVEGNGLQLYASDNIAAKATDEYKVVFTPQKEGDFTGKITFIASNGATATTDIKATVGAAPDFSSIVKEGDFVFSYSTDNPFAVTDTITGYPVAVSTCDDNSYTSTLNAVFTVPEGKTGVLSWNGSCTAMQPNGITVTLDDESVYNDVYTYNGILGHDDLANICVVGEGSHELTFTYILSMDWYKSGTVNEELKAWIYNLSLQLTDNADNAAVAKDNSVDFGRHYYDNLSVIDTATVSLVNAGSSELMLNSVTSSDNFTAIVDGATAAYGTELPVKILFTADEVGTFSDDIVLHTTAGDFTVNCNASTEKIIYDYSPIVTEGSFSFNTSFDYPFIIENDSAKSNISGLNPAGIDLTAWLEASFDVPEGQEGLLTWDGHNSSLDFLYFLDSQILENGTFITLDGGNRQEYAGIDEDCGSTTYDIASRTFQAGRHNVRFSYMKVNTDVVGLDRLAVSNLALHLQKTSISGPDTDKQIVRTEIYSLDGKQLNQLQKGVNIVRQVYSDGTVSTSKQIVNL